MEIKLEISEDSVSIYSGETEVFRLSALGGPDDNVLINCSNNHVELDYKSLNEFQMAIINFMNTGYFDQEG